MYINLPHSLLLALTQDLLHQFQLTPVLFSRFCGVTGLSADEMRAAANEPGFLGGVLDFLTAHEPTLMAFCESSAQPPERVARAGQLIGGNGQAGDGS